MAKAPSKLSRKSTAANQPVPAGQKPAFGSGVLGLGDLALPTQEIDVIAAMFDLAGFTKFCNRVDPHLSIHKYLNDFLEWLFAKIADGLSNGRQGHWAELPFFSKFRGDGVLFLWNTSGMTRPVICRILALLCEIRQAYKSEFMPKIMNDIDKPPRVLRCGIARGKAFSVGEGKDYVGHCINNASRLQKVGPITFCFAQRGFPAQQYMPVNYQGKFVLKRTAIRGVGEDELVWVLKSEFNRLPPKYGDLFRDP
ncbi:MAG: hypothetical protein PHR43_03305 [Dehalococcoidales bacterium]|nr:hypothetical protein [Dehalococcoidales bacterium]